MAAMGQLSLSVRMKVQFNMESSRSKKRVVVLWRDGATSATLFWSVDDKRKREESLQSLPPMDMDMEMVRRCTIGLERKKESGTDLVIGDTEVIAEELLC